MFFNGWDVLGRTVIVGVLAYVALVLLLRISGKRTLSKMNAFDFIVTIALGSTLATILLSADVALAEGVLALGLLIGLQYLLTWTSVRSEKFGQLVKAEPMLLYYEGEFLEGAMKRERVMRDEVLAAMRRKGVESLADVSTVVLETDGRFSVTKKNGEAADSAMDTVILPREAQ